MARKEKEVSKIKEEFSLEPYYSPEQRKLLLRFSLFKALKALMFFAAAVLLLLGIIFYLDSKSLTCFIIAIVMIVFGIAAAVFQGFFRKDSYKVAVRKYDEFFKNTATGEALILQKEKRSFAVKGIADGEILVYQDCALAFKVNKYDVVSADFALDTVSKRDKEGKVPYYVPFLIKTKGGEEHYIRLTNSYQTMNMYEPDVSKSRLSDMNKNNTAILLTLKSWFASDSGIKPDVK